MSTLSVQAEAGVAAFPPSEGAQHAASAAGPGGLATLRRHWPEYLMEATGLGVFMISACVFATVLEHPGSPVRQAVADPLLRRIPMGLAMGATAVAIVYSRWGQRSGAHLNPAVTLVVALRREVAVPLAAAYVLAQVAGGILGGFLAHAMFELPVLQVGTVARGGTGQWLAEGVATFGLVATILGGLRSRPKAIPWLVGLYITAAYWFTASTSFANPAVAIARALSDTFAGIRPRDVPAFVLAEAAGAVIALGVMGWLLATGGEHAKPSSALRRKRAFPIADP